MERVDGEGLQEERGGEAGYVCVCRGRGGGGGGANFQLAVLPMTGK